MLNSKSLRLTLFISSPFPTMKMRKKKKTKTTPTKKPWSRKKKREKKQNDFPRPSSYSSLPRITSDGGTSVMPTYSVKFRVLLSVPGLSRARTHSTNQGVGAHTGPHS